MNEADGRHIEERPGAVLGRRGLLGAVAATGWWPGGWTSTAGGWST